MATHTPARALTASALGTMLTLVAFTTPLTTINSTGVALDAGTAGRTWILSAMSVGLGAALLSSGALADDFGRRRAFRVGLVVLALGSIACAVAPDVWLVVAGRIVQGVGGAAVIASSLGIIANEYAAGPARAAASGVWGASVGAGIALGPIVAGVLDQVASWREAYVVLTVAAMILAGVTGLMVAESRSETPRGIDVAGSGLMAAGVTALLAAVIEGRNGWEQPQVIVLAALAVVVLIGFVLVESRSSKAMLDLSLFAHRPFVAATVAGLATGAGIIALMAYLASFLGFALGVSPLVAALFVLAWSLTSVVTALLARRIPARISGRTQLAIGLFGVAAGQLSLLGIDESTRPVNLLPGLLIAGAASGVLNAALGREAVASVPAGRSAMGSGANNTARYVSSAIGITVVAVIVGSGGGSGGLADAFAGWNTAVILTASVSIVGALVVLASRTRTSTTADSSQQTQAARS